MHREEELWQVYSTAERAYPSCSQSNVWAIPYQRSNECPHRRSVQIKPRSFYGKSWLKRKDSSASYDVQLEHLVPRRRRVDDSKPVPLKLPRGLSFNVVCKSCDWRRSEHVGADGSSFSSNFFFSSCARWGLNKRQHGTLIPIGVLLHNCGVTRKKAKRYEENVKGWATIDCSLLIVIDCIFVSHPKFSY